MSGLPNLASVEPTISQILSETPMFRTHKDGDGMFGAPSLVVHGPKLPGAFVTWVPSIENMQLRHGMIVAVHDNQVDVVWNPWSEQPGILVGQLRKQMKALGYVKP